ncbi:hypothetical protein FSP39_017634 [Pinctada imbricata]|uniref:Uncharacterized protein n=1 Tax=Pinctada imbricata TaxID=66713 RepID=A0AA89BKQ8_PINIB|nr:hypothetical protein FSP39_017634 [Pinctada imbricata]
MPICEKSKLLDDARRGAPEMIEKFKERQRLLFEKKLEILRSKQEKKALMDAKQYTQKVRLTAKLQDVGGVWTCPGDIEHFKTSQGRVTLKEAIITQLQFRKTVLGSKGPREKFQQSLKGNPYSLSQLEQNLLDIIEINKENESLENADNSNSLSYFSEEQVQENIKEAKLKLSQKLREGRNKILINQQSSRLPELVERPETLVGKTIIHKFKEVGSNEITWYTGEVLSIHKANGRLTKYNVRYEDEELNRFPLLTDMEKGDLIIKD